MVIVSPSILRQLEFHLVQNQEINCLHIHIPFNLKGNLFFLLYLGTHTSRYRKYVQDDPNFVCVIFGIENEVEFEGGLW